MHPLRTLGITLLCLSLLGMGIVTPVMAEPTPSTQHANSQNTQSSHSQASQSQLNQSQLNQTQSNPTSRNTVGYWGGVWYNETFSFDGNNSAYLNSTQISKLTNRTIARIEYMRNDTFDSRPPVNIVTRNQYQQGSSGYAQKKGTRKEWNNIVWESVFIVENDENVEKELQKLYGGQVRAFYSPSQDELYIIVPQDQTELVQFKSTSLAHELVHAYQDQKFDLSSDRYRTKTQDGALAKDSVVEGEAVYLETKFKQRCESDTWSCYIPENGESTTSGADLNIGLQLTAYFPYSDGHAYVKHQYEEGGWEKVNKSYYSVPDSTTDIIHYQNPPQTVDVQIEDDSSTDWGTFTHGDNGAEEVGEATLAIMYWYQNHEYNINTGVSNQQLTNTNDASRYNYDYEMTAGLRGDSVLPYRSSDSNETGYVLQTEWVSEEDATEFKVAYLRILLGHNGEKHKTSLPGQVYQLPEESGYSGVYYINQSGTTLTITHADSLDSIKEIQGIEQRTKPIGDSTPWYVDYIEDVPLTTLFVLGGCIMLFIGFLIKVLVVDPFRD